MPKKYEIGDKVVGTMGKFKFCKGVIVGSQTTEKGLATYNIEFELLDRSGILTKEDVTFTKSSFRRFKDQDVQEGAQSLLHIGSKRAVEQSDHSLDADNSSDEENGQAAAAPFIVSSSHASVGDLINQHILRPLHEHAKYQDKKYQVKRINARVICVVCNFHARSYCLQCSEKSGCVVAVHNPFPSSDPGDLHRATACYISHITATARPDEDK